MAKWPKPAMIVKDVVAAFNALARISKAQGLTLVQEKGCTQPRTDLRSGKTFVEPPNPYWSDARFNKWRGEVYHEVGHHAPEVTDTLTLFEAKGLSFNSLWGKIYNIIDDKRNEYNAFGMWVGRDECLSWTQAFYCKRGATTLTDDYAGLDKDMKLFCDVLGWCYAQRAEWQPDLVLPSYEFSEIVDDEQFHKLTDSLENLRTAEDVYDLVNKIIDASPEHDAEEEEAKSKEAGSEESEGEGSDGKAKSDESDKEGEGEAAAPGSVSYKDLMGHVHGETDGFSDGKIDYDHETKRDYKPWDKMKVEEASSLRKTAHWDYRGSMDEAYEQGSNLAGIARRLFQARTQSMITHNHKQGRIDKRDFYRIPTGSVDVFTQRSAVPDTKDTALFLLCDMSSSMHGDKLSAMAAAVALLNDAVIPLGLPVEVAGFTESRITGCQHYYVKHYDERVSSDNILDRFERMAGKMRQNADGESIMWAYNCLKVRPEKRKMLIVLSDGMPCCDNAGDCFTYTKDVVATVAKQIEIYGIGMLDASVKHFYPEYSVLKKTSELETCLLNLIKEKIL